MYSAPKINVFVVGLYGKTKVYSTLTKPINFKDEVEKKWFKADCYINLPHEDLSWLKEVLKGVHVAHTFW